MTVGSIGRDDDTLERPPRFYGSDDEGIKGVDNVQEVGLGVYPSEFKFMVSYPDAEGYTITLDRPAGFGEWSDLR